MDNIKSISIESGERCDVDPNRLHEILLRLPTNIYLDLYRLMQVRMGDKYPVQTVSSTPTYMDYDTIHKASRDVALKNTFQIAH